MQNILQYKNSLNASNIVLKIHRFLIKFQFAKGSQILIRNIVALVILTIALFFQEILLGRHSNMPFFILYPSIVLATWLCGIQPAMVTVILGAVLSNFLFIEPAGMFSTGWEPVVATLSFIAVGSMTVTLVGSYCNLLSRFITSELRLKDAMQTADFATWEWDLITNNVTYSENFSRITGFEIEKHDPEFLWMHYEDRERITKAVNEAIAERKSYRLELRAKNNDGTYRWIETMGRVITSIDKIPLRVIGVVLNIDERMKTEEKIKEKAQELAKTNAKLSDTNAELERFAYVASHDLKEPLRTVNNYTELLAKEYKNKLGQNADEIIKFITNGTTRMQRMIDDLLKYSRSGLKTNPLVSINTLSLIESVLKNLDVQMKESNAKVYYSNLPEIYADPCQIFQLFQNLISNAIKYKKNTPPIIKITCEDRDNTFVFAVSDNGIGIESKYYLKVFDLFLRLHNQEQYEGTGIGLAICKRIVQRHEGEIWIESTPGEGSTFYFTLPIKRVVSADDKAA